jgi:hypothetical protein
VESKAGNIAVVILQQGFPTRLSAKKCVYWMLNFHVRRVYIRNQQVCADGLEPVQDLAEWRITALKLDSTCFLTPVAVLFRPLLLVLHPLFKILNRFLQCSLRLISNPCSHAFFSNVDSGIVQFNDDGFAREVWDKILRSDY